VKDFRRLGGVAALVTAATFVAGFVLAATVLTDYTIGEPEPSEAVAFLADNQAVTYIWNLIIWVVFGIFLVVLALALYERLRDGSPALALTATAFGLIWAALVIATGMVANNNLLTVVGLYDQDPAQAASLWLTLDTVENGLAGTFEIPGGMWVLLTSWAAIQAGVLPKALNYLGVVIGIAGLLTIIPVGEGFGGEPFAIVFGLGLIVWFVWLGVIMLRSRPTAVA
jgi:hypothetical protein